jgi:hypothetical protein
MSNTFRTAQGTTIPINIQTMNALGLTNKVHRDSQFGRDPEVNITLFLLALFDQLFISLTALFLKIKVPSIL